ncbi:RNA polymerase II holoenzyme cyclin-like subunit [Ceratocystis lukuohia]|uniref:RNA polymerase II holoenzyme cyclin-like subunit n=1 Tax=Ceratocystis lukuohia TaxID=2019550 RepID=A0ABR4MUK9_9PEZI
MSANYWESTHRRYWNFTKDQLATMRQKLEDQNPELVQMYPLQQQRHLYIYFNTQINRLSKRLAIRQQAISTAQVYLKRYYTRVEIRRTNPYLVIAAAVYLACKIEECPQHIRFIVNEAKSLWQDFVTIDTGRLGECEFALISEMDSHMIVHQPYRTLQALQGDLTLTQEDVALAWSLINDSYMTDLPLLVDPHIIALTAIMLSLVLRPSPPNHSATGQQQTMSIGQVNLASMTNASAAIMQAAHVHAQTQAHPHAQSYSHAQAQNMSHPGLNAAGTSGSSNGGSGSGGGPAAEALPKKNMRFTRVQQYTVWLAESNVDITAIVDCTQEMVYFYEMQEQYNDKVTKEQINRFIKARELDK